MPPEEDQAPVSKPPLNEAGAARSSTEQTREWESRRRSQPAGCEGVARMLLKLFVGLLVIIIVSFGLLAGFCAIKR